MSPTISQAGDLMLGRGVAGALAERLILSLSDADGSPDSAGQALAGREVVQRVDERRALSDREVEVRAEAATRVADPTDDRPGLDKGSLRHVDAR
jgi:hypothetical protein